MVGHYIGKDQFRDIILATTTKREALVGVKIFLSKGKFEIS